MGTAKKLQQLRYNLTGYYFSREHRLKIGLASRGRKHPHSEETRTKISRALRDKSRAERPQTSEAPQRRSEAETYPHRKKEPNYVESYLLSILDEAEPAGWVYAGDGSFTIGRMRPDFVNINGRKSVVELFGNYWHTPEGERERIRKFKDFGFECVVIWEEELVNREAVMRHIKNGGSYQPKREDTGKGLLEGVPVMKLKSRIPSW